MQNTKLFVVLITGLCFKVNMGSEEYISSSRHNENEPFYTSDTHNDQIPYRYPVKGLQNPNHYGPPHHHHHNKWFFSADHHESSHPDSGNPRNLPLSPETTTKTPDIQRQNSNEIPLDVAKKMDTIDIEDFLANYVDGYVEEPKTIVSTRFQDDVQERKSRIIPAKAKCSVENTTVPVATSDDPSIFYIPKCTKIERCSGCCSHEKLACQPVLTETISVEVYKLQWKILNQKFRYAAKEIVPLERHIECSCDCKIKAEDCYPYQQYVKDNCECVCSNVDEELKCVKDSIKKSWNPESCTCECLTYSDCLTGFTFDHNECKCKASPKRRNVLNERHEYSTEDLQIYPLDDTN